MICFPWPFRDRHGRQQQRQPQDGTVRVRVTVLFMNQFHRTIFSFVTRIFHYRDKQNSQRYLLWPLSWSILDSRGGLVTSASNPRYLVSATCISYSMNWLQFFGARNCQIVVRTAPLGRLQSQHWRICSLVGEIREGLVKTGFVAPAITILAVISPRSCGSILLICSNLLFPLAHLAALKHCYREVLKNRAGCKEPEGKHLLLWKLPCPVSYH